MHPNCSPRRYVACRCVEIDIRKAAGQQLELSETPDSRATFACVTASRALRPIVCSHGQCVDEDIIILFRFVMEVIAADAEIERAAEMRSQPEFLAQLPGMFIRKILGNKPVAAAQLRIAKNAIRNALITSLPSNGSASVSYSAR